jgi:hypothetical protein
MHTISYVAAGLAVFGFAGLAARNVLAEPQTHISDPNTYDNLSVYFIRGTSAAGPVPLTLQEALAKGSVRLLETGSVNELKIENTGSDEVFIQAGDIVKGGRQDRVLNLSFVLPPKSGEVPLAAFCVEHGRWSARGNENARVFASADEAMPSLKAKLAMAAPRPTEPISRPVLGEGSAAARPNESLRSYLNTAPQAEVWALVAETQTKLAARLQESVASPDSETSLQLSLENEKLKAERTRYVDALQASGEKGDDIVGYVLAVNGHIASADVYPSNALFRKMWPKQLAAGVTEAIGGKVDKAAPAPSAKEAEQFLAAAEAGRGSEEAVNNLARRSVREADSALYVEAQRSDGAWVHRSYLAK